MSNQPESLPRIDVETIRSKSYERNMAKPTAEPCALCGREVKVTDSTRFVQISNGDELIPDHEGEPADSLGSYPVGADCAKRIPAGY